KQFLKSLSSHLYPVFQSLVLAVILMFAVISGAIFEEKGQAASPKAKRELLLMDRKIAAGTPGLFPSHQATMVNPDVQLKLIFKNAPRVGTKGKIRIYDAADDQVVDTLDLSIPPGPTKPVDPAIRAKNYLAFPYPYARAKRPTN